MSSRPRTDTYYIANRETIEDDVLNRWMLDSFATGNMLAEHRGMTDKILLEDIPSGTEHLPPILKGLRENRRMQLVYRSYRSATHTETVVEPLCVKMFKRRWYLLACKAGVQELRIYALDRIRELSPTDEYSQPATVRLKAYAELSHYLWSLRTSAKP